ncbi:HD domain-containing protein [Bosea rubneri]|uniref:HD domain-containing protein n=1 Tax=Bosea rubneri TaxID=3075434 RepID=A0ABU3SC64_9HYPH|nr:HD domain-containing protein [Bosea sp. ZW T0_25]MDU0341982.1 HD domain-containing protein [Bosea sp. ZW T0_25]
MGNLERAIEIAAAAAHAGQTDKAGAPYISHPLRVALGFIRARDEERAIIAVLHDVIEDSAITATELRGEGFSEAIVEAVEALSRLHPPCCCERTRQAGEGRGSQGQPKSR